MVDDHPGAENSDPLSPHRSNMSAALITRKGIMDGAYLRGRRRKTAARHDVLDGYRASHTTAAMSTSAARAAVTSPPSLVLRGSARRCRIPCRPRM